MPRRIPLILPPCIPLGGPYRRYETAAASPLVRCRTAALAARVVGVPALDERAHALLEVVTAHRELLGERFALEGVVQIADQTAEHELLGEAHGDRRRARE